MKTSHEMAQSVLEKQKRILHRRKTALTAVGVTAGAGMIAGVSAIAIVLFPSKGFDLVESNTHDSGLTISAAQNTCPLDLLGCVTSEQGKYSVDKGNWEISDNYELFRKYFFGTWESNDETFAKELAVNDTEQAFFAQNNAFRFKDFYIVSNNVLAFVIHGNAESELFWLDINYPGTMYCEPFIEDCQINCITPEMAESEWYGSGWLYDIDELPHKPAVYSKSAEPAELPEDNYLSIFELLEISRDYGIDREMLLNIEYTDKTSGKALFHDDWYHFYAVKLISKEQDRLVLSTTLGNSADDTAEAQVTYTIEKVGGEWTRTEEIGITAPDDNLGINEDVISELGMTYRELADKYGSEPKRVKYNNSFSIGNGYGRYIWKTSSGWTYDNMEVAGGCNGIDGVKMSDLFSGISYPVKYEELVDKYSFTLINSGTEPGMFDLYESTFEHPSCGDIRFYFYAREYGVIEEDISCTIMLKNAAIPNEKLFSSEDWNDYSETANNAAEAFLRNDKEKLSEYLYDPNYDAGLSDNSENLFDVLDYSELILIDGSVAEFETGKVYPAVYKFAILDSDMLFFLDIGLRKTDIGWKVDYIYLQG